jgi:hypothetical protein
MVPSLRCLIGDSLIDRKRGERHTNDLHFVCLQKKLESFKVGVCVPRQKVRNVFHMPTERVCEIL